MHLTVESQTQPTILTEVQPKHSPRKLQNLSFFCSTFCKTSSRRYFDDLFQIVEISTVLEIDNLLFVLGMSVGTEILLKREFLTDFARHRQGCGRLEASLG